MNGDESHGGVEMEVGSEKDTMRSGMHGSNRNHSMGSKVEEGGAAEVTPAKQSHKVSDCVITGGTKILENLARDKPDFQDLVRGIDAEISKFDSTVVGSSQIGPEIALLQPMGQPNSKEMDGSGSPSNLVMLDSLQGSPHDNNSKTRSWKRLVQERTPTETQTVTFLKKRPYSGALFDGGVVHLDSTQQSEGKAAGLGRRSHCEKSEGVVAGVHGCASYSYTASHPTGESKMEATWCRTVQDQL
nr:hypothetical protein CFP56_05062 [Quercus suber]